MGEDPEASCSSRVKASRRWETWATREAEGGVAEEGGGRGYILGLPVGSGSELGWIGEEEEAWIGEGALAGLGRGAGPTGLRQGGRGRPRSPRGRVSVEKLRRVRRILTRGPRPVSAAASVAGVGRRRGSVILAP